MAVFFGLIHLVVPAIDMFDFSPQDMGMSTLIVTVIQLVFALVIVQLMKRDGSYLVLDHAGFRLGDLFRPILGWMFILFKFGAIFAVVQLLPSDVLKTQPVGIVLALVLSLSIGLFEEYLFRGFMFKNMIKGKDESAVIPAALISSLLFGLFHIDFVMVLKGVNTGQIGTAFFAFGVGFYLAAITYRFGKMWIPIMIHALIDFPTFLMIALVDTGKIFEYIEPYLDEMTLSMTDLGTEGGNPAIVLLGLMFLVAGGRMLRKTTNARRMERITREELDRQSSVNQSDYFPSPDNFLHDDKYDQIDSLQNETETERNKDVNE